MNVDLLIHSAAQAVTCASPDGPKRGKAMRDPGLIPDGAVAITGGKIVEAGPSADLRARCTASQEIDASGKVVCPGFVDPHTHVVYAGDRVSEFEQRLGGATYMEIMQAGGGIASTMRAVRQASEEELLAQSRQRVEEMLRLGTTTLEIKTGYGLDVENELKMLRVISGLQQALPVDIVPTFLGAHAYPPEFQGDHEGYLELIVAEMLPAAAEWYAKSPFPRQGKSFYCDVFCEAGVFDLEQSRVVLEAGRAMGLRPKLHADEFESLGGVSLALEMSAVSVDHLDVTQPGELRALAGSDTVGVVLPVVNFHLGSDKFADARGLIDAGGVLALATDINPGSAPCPSMPLAMAIACRFQRLMPAEALNAATINAAYAVGMGRKLGSIEPGKQADLLVLDMPDYRHLVYEIGVNRVETVIKNGMVV